MQFYNFNFLGSAIIEIFNYKSFHYKGPINAIKYVDFFLPNKHR